MIPDTTVSALGGRRGAPPLVLGPSLGTSGPQLWGETAALLADDAEVLAWDLPGHGDNKSVGGEGFTMAELAAGVLAALDRVVGGRTFSYAGDSVGGAVGLQLALDAPHRLAGLAVVCSGAKILDDETWSDRIDAVRASGTAGLVEGSVQRWFGPGFLDREPERGSALLHTLQAVDDLGYEQVCGALAGFDVRDRLGEVATPVLAVAGSHDASAPPAGLRLVAGGVQDGRYVELPGVAHLAPAEAPEVVAELLRGLLRGTGGTSPYDAGLAVRREVLGSDYVDAALAGTTDLTRDFQELITAYAWGSVWTRPGLDRRSRSIATLTALVARGHHEELALHLRAARTNGLTLEEIKEVLLQSAIYCGVPDANTAFRIARQVFEEDS